MPYLQLTPNLSLQPFQTNAQNPNTQPTPYLPTPTDNTPSNRNPPINPTLPPTPPKNNPPTVKFGFMGFFQCPNRTNKKVANFSHDGDEYQYKLPAKKTEYFIDVIILPQEALQ